MAEARPFLVYRDRIGAPSEIAFLRRQYLGFSHLRPVWIGRTLLPRAPEVGDDRLRLGGDGPLGAVRRALFRHAGIAPPIAVTSLAPVLHAQFARGGALALPITRALGMTMVVTLHGGDITKQKNWRPGSLLARRWPELVKQAARFICVSGAVAEVAASHGVPEAKLTILPIGVDVPAEPPRRQPGSYLFVGRFVEKKGISVLAEAIRRLRTEGDTTPLVCVGEGPMRPLLVSLAASTQGVKLTGWLPQQEVREHMTRAVALIVPSIVASDGDAEGLPSVIPEAMSLGCPVIGSAQGGIAEAVHDGVTGLLAPPGDAAALAHAMRRISADPALSTHLGAASYQKAAEALNAMRQSAKLEALLLSVVPR